PGVANWLECTGHRRGYIQIRWQRLARDLGPADGPAVDVVPLEDLAALLPYYQQARVTPKEHAERIAARQAAVAARSVGCRCWRAPWSPSPASARAWAGRLRCKAPGPARTWCWRPVPRPGLTRWPRRSPRSAAAP